MFKTRKKQVPTPTLTAGLHDHLTREIESLTGRDVICVHPDGRLSVGMMEEMTKVGSFSVPVPIVFDYMTKQRIACLGKVFDYNEELLEAMNVMSSGQRVMVLFSSPAMTMKIPHPSSDVYTTAQLAEARNLGKGE